MDLSVLKKKTALALGGLLALTVGAGSMQASVLSSSATSVAAMTATLTCNTQTGPSVTPVSVTIHASPAPTGTHTWTVGFVAAAGLKVTAPASPVLTAANNATGIVFTINSLPGCAGLSTAASGVNTISVQLTSQADVGLGTQGAVGNDNSITVTDTLTATASPLVAPNVTITCAYRSSGSIYVPGSPQMVGVTSAANGGTPFTVTTANAPAWLGFGPVAPAGVAGTTAAYFSVFANSGCGGFTTDQTYLLPIAITPGPSITITVTMHFTTLSPLTVTPVPAAPGITLSYVKNSATPGIANVSVTSTVNNVYFTVNTSTLPIWLTPSVTGATVPAGGKSMSFTTTAAADSLAPGTYTATVFLQVSGYGDYPVPITALVTNKPARLVITSPNPQPVTYNLGGSTPVTTITVASSDSPIPYSVTTAGVLAPQLVNATQATGIAYSFGSQINFTYDPAIFQSSPPGTVVTGTVTFTWGSPASSTVVTINLTVASAAAMVTSISPASLPTAAAGTTFYLTVAGSGFVASADPTLATRVGIVTGAMPGTLNMDTNITVSSVTNPSNLTLKIVVPASADGNLPFTVGGAGGPVYLGFVNGTGTSIPTGYATLNIGGAPIIYGVTSASSFTEVSGGNLPNLAPYDMVSIFGANFCAAGTVPTNCSSTTILPGAPDPVTLRFPFWLTPDGAAPASGNDTRRQVSVTFYPHGQTTGGLPAPLLFATNGQINAIIPGGVSTTTEYYDVVVSFGCPLLSGSVGCAASTVATSPGFEVNIVPTDPGIFTVGSDGQGQAAALSFPAYALITTANPAGMRYAQSDSDTIQVYVTGLGVPNAGSAYGSNNGTCIGALGTGYLAALTTNYASLAGLSNIDGFVLNNTLFPGDNPPCVTNPTATLGGINAPVTWAGFVGETVAGLYQVNVQLPSTQNLLQPNYPSSAGQFTNLAAPAQLPLFITAGGQKTQASVMVPVAPRLTMTLEGLTGASAITAASNASAAVLTTASAPANGTVIFISGFTGSWTSANGFQTVSNRTATTFQIAVNSTSFNALAGTPVFTLPSLVTGVTENLSIGHAMTSTTIVGNWNGSHSGVTYAITAGVLPQGLSLVSANNIATISGIPAQGTAGNYPITITATNSSSVPITGTVSFTYYIPGGLFVTATGASASTFGTANTAVSTVTAVGGTAPYNQFAITSTPAVTGLSITTGGVLQTDVTTPAGVYTVTVTATDSAGLTGTINIPFTVGLELSMAPQSPISQLASYVSALTTVTVSGGSGTYTCSVDGTSTFPTAANLSFTGCALYVGTASAGGPGTVVIDVVDTGAAPSGGANPPQAQITLNSLTLN